MKLQEKILYCRKRAGLSQEALSEKLGISRQAISKWETGEAVPEISKLLLLANTFHVTIDWLLSEDEPEVEYTDNTSSSTASIPEMPNTSWVDSLPNFIGQLIRRFGWILGVYLTLIGAGITGMGVLARYMVRQMFGNMFGNVFDNKLFSSADQFQTNGIHYNGVDWYVGIDKTMSNFATNNPVYTMGMVFIVIGVLIMIVGIIATIMLRRLYKKAR